MATQRLKNGKAAGWDGLVAEVLKNCSCDLFVSPFQILSEISRSLSMWQRGIIHPVLKASPPMKGVVIVFQLCIDDTSKILLLSILRLK